MLNGYERMISHYLIDIIILLLAAVVIVPAAQMVRLGAVPGFLIAGVLVGPYGLGLINKISEISNLAEIGVVLLLFVIGIELKPSRLWLMKRMVFGLGTFQLIVTGSVLAAAGYFIFDVPLRATILVGAALALSSTAFVLQLLTEQNLLTSLYGRTSIAVLLLQDLAVVPLLALIPLLAMPEMSIGTDIGIALVESLAILILIILSGRFLLHPLLHRVALSRNPEIFTASALLIVLGTALITEHIGLSMAMGAFLAGLLISDSAYRHQVLAEIQPFRGLLLGLFFMSMGMSLNLELLFNQPIPAIALVGLLMTLKILLLIPLTYWFGLKIKNALAVSLLLAQSGEFALVLFSLAFQAKVLSHYLFQHLLLIVLLSMLATPVLAHFAQRLVKQQSNKKEKNLDMPDNPPVVLAGFGRVGHRIGDILSLANENYVALDADAAIVEQQRANGYPVFYGDVRQPETMRAAGASNARIIIVTLNDPEATEKVVTSLRKTFPDTPIYARGHSLTQCQELRQLGASGVVSENIEASLELARMTLKTLGMEQEKQDTLLGDFRIAYHNQIDRAVTSSLPRH